MNEKKRKIITNIVNMSFHSNAQGQRTHSARTKMDISYIYIFLYNSKQSFRLIIGEDMNYGRLVYIGYSVESLLMDIYPPSIMTKPLGCSNEQFTKIKINP